VGVYKEKVRTNKNDWLYDWTLDIGHWTLDMTFRNCEPGQAIMSVFALIGNLERKLIHLR
jgi:hypothetical protein